jgi:Arc/MetJ-type ribon-helix-helix transcriptional regulator
MNITLPPDLEKRLTERVRQGDVPNAESFVEQALTFYLDYDANEMDEAEVRETRAAIDEAREQSRRGEAVSAEEVFAEFRAKHGIPR